MCGAEMYLTSETLMKARVSLLGQWGVNHVRKIPGGALNEDTIMLPVGEGLCSLQTITAKTESNNKTESVKFNPTAAGFVGSFHFNPSFQASSFAFVPEPQRFKLLSVSQGTTGRCGCGSGVTMTG